MDLIETLHSMGFFRISVLDGEEAGTDGKRLILAFMSYKPDLHTENSRDAVVHPYYPTSQRAYIAAADAADKFSIQGLPVRLRTDIPLKRILDRLTFIKTGMNTLGYITGVGSRFHVQSLTLDMKIKITDRLIKTNSSEENIIKPKRDDSCKDCRLCEKVCPTHAINSGKFDRFKCIRNWMLIGKRIPVDISERMGNRLIGCDICQGICPLNSYIQTVYQPELRIKLRELLNSDIDLSELIGRNLAVRNRVLAQACIIAANCSRDDLLPQIKLLMEHNSQNVRYCAEYAYKRLIISKSKP